MVQFFTPHKSLHSCKPPKVKNGVEKLTLQLEAASPVQCRDDTKQSLCRNHASLSPEAAAEVG